MKKTKSILTVWVFLLILSAAPSCVVVQQHDNGRHRGWYHHRPYHHSPRGNVIIIEKGNGKFKNNGKHDRHESKARRHDKGRF